MLTDGVVTLTGDNPRNFEIALRIAHPTVDPAEITRELTLNPTGIQKAGEPRKTSKGAPLDGLYPESVWQYRSRFTVENQWFSGALKSFVNNLLRHKAFFHQLVASGGNIGINLILLGMGILAMNWSRNY